MRRMLSVIQYRGPDESGMYIGDSIVLGSVRLSIVDIQSGQQPMFSPDANYSIVFNGEIFNYPEIRTDLIKHGFKFRTQSDTEVLLNAYIAWGEGCLKRLNGQFALAIWNNEKKTLFLARDRVGVRPLFYTAVNNVFVFGSEIKCLLEFPGISAKIDPVSLSQVFTLWTTITPRSIFKGIHELPPGHCMTISSDGNTIRRFWCMTFPVNPLAFKGTLNEAGDELEHLLSDSVRIRLRADVPVAAYLSGGIDSGATTVLIRSAAPETLQTFSIGFEETEFDESHFQKEVSDYLGTRHSSFTCSTDDIGKYFPDVIWHSEIPVLRTAPVPMLLLSRKVRENGIKVIITGEGADEMLGGYDIFKEAIIRDFWSLQPDSRLRPMLLNKLYPYLAQFQGKNKSVLKLFYNYRLSDTGSPFYSHLLRWHNTSSLINYFSDDYRDAARKYDCTHDIIPMLPERFEDYDRLSKAQWLEIALFMSGYLLSSQGDRVSMANSVEGRYPFLDYRVIEFASSLPSDFKIKGLNEKFLLKKMMAGRLPESVIRRPKQAYRAPLASGFFSKSGMQYVPDLLTEHALKNTGIFDFQAIQKLVKKTSQQSAVSEIENMALAGILSTQILMHQYVIGNSFRPTVKPLVNCKVYDERKATQNPLLK